jgi:hypothetical protein
MITSNIENNEVISSDGTKIMNHASYQAEVRSISNAVLAYIVKDAEEAIKANPNSANAGYYMDEIHYVQMELRRREVCA